MVAARAQAAGLDKIRTILCTERSVELAQDSIDLAFICDVYHHFEYPQQSLASLHRALRRKGEVFLVDFKRIPGVSSDWILNHVRAGQEQVEAEFAAAGFEKVEQVVFLLLPEVWDRFLQKIVTFRRNAAQNRQGPDAGRLEPWQHARRRAV